MFMCIGLLASLAWIMSLSADLFEILGHGVSGRDIILIGGGGFLLAKFTREMHSALEHQESDPAGAPVATFGGVLVQIGLIDIVFSLDSLIIAVRLVDDLPVMIAAIVVAVLVMMAAAGPVSTDHGSCWPSSGFLLMSLILVAGMAILADLAVAVAKLFRGIQDRSTKKRRMRGA